MVQFVESGKTRRLERTPAALPLPPEICPANFVCIHPAGPLMGQRFALSRFPSRVGRDDSCLIRLEDRSVSRFHAVIEHTVDGITVTDLDSTNGTFVNDVAAFGTPLADGDYLRVGSCTLRYLASGNVETAYHEAIYQLTVTDGLTGAYNRRYLMEFLDRETSRARRYSRPLSVAVLDVDRFKSINDTHGHPGGDAMLRELLAVVRRSVREEQLVARYGGEEFVIVFPEERAEGAAEACERLRHQIACHTYRYGGTYITLTASFGVAERTAEMATAEDLIRAADAKLYEAKATGRNRVAW